jgi:hypothetical protein
VLRSTPPRIFLGRIAASAGPRHRFLVAWHEQRPGPDWIRAVLLRPDHSRRHPQTITATAAADAPALAAAADGTFLAVWVRRSPSGTTAQIQAARGRADGFGPARTLGDASPPTVPMAGITSPAPIVTLDRSGRATVVWQRTIATQRPEQPFRMEIVGTDAKLRL